jgi:hypothetical protein
LEATNRMAWQNLPDQRFLMIGGSHDCLKVLPIFHRNINVYHYCFRPVGVGEDVSMER